MATNSGLIPDLNSSGTYTLKAPFDASIKSTRTYKCIEIRKLAAIVAAGTDAEAIYYTNTYSIDSSVYQTDLSNDVSIITLQSSAGDLVYVPSSYILSYPKGGGVNYSVVGLAINLGALPTSLDLTVLKDTIAQTTKDKLGVTATIQEATLSAVEQVSQSDHASMEATRLANVSVPETERARALAAEAQVTSCQTKIAQLESYILSIEKSKSSTGVSTPDFTTYMTDLLGLVMGETLTDAQATMLAGYMQKLDQQTTASKWNADATSTSYSLQGATIMYNGKTSTDMPANADFNRVLILQLRSDVTVPQQWLFVNYNQLVS